MGKEWDLLGAALRYQVISVPRESLGVVGPGLREWMGPRKGGEDVGWCLVLVMGLLVGTRRLTARAWNVVQVMGQEWDLLGAALRYQMISVPSESLSSVRTRLKKWIGPRKGGEDVGL